MAKMANELEARSIVNHSRERRIKASSGTKNNIKFREVAKYNQTSLVGSNECKRCCCCSTFVFITARELWAKRGLCLAKIIRFERSIYGTEKNPYNLSIDVFINTF